MKKNEGIIRIRVVLFLNILSCIRRLCDCMWIV